MPITGTAWNICFTGGMNPQPLLNSVRSGSSAIWIGTICSAKISRNRVLLHLNFTHARPYAAISAITSGTMAAGIEITNELMKYGAMPCGIVVPPLITWE